MSSATSTRKTAGASEAPGDPGGTLRTSPRTGTDGSGGIRPWQFFVLAALGCATAVTWMARGDGVTAVVLLTLLMGSAALAGLATYRMVGPLVSETSDRTVMIGQRTRTALEREKTLTLRAIKDLEFDRAMKKVSDADFSEMVGPLRLRAGRLMRQLDAGAGYRERIEQDLVKRLGDRRSGDQPPRAAAGAPLRTCGGCSTANDADARFCKACGAQL